MYDTILAPIDISQSDQGNKTLARAAELALGTGAKLCLVTVLSDVPNLVAMHLPRDYAERARRDAEAKLDAAAEAHGLEQGHYMHIVRHGHIYREILAAAEEVHADLIVIASHQPDASDYLLGSVAAKVVRHARCSVLVLRSRR